MPGPTTTLGSPLNVTGGGGAGAAGGSGSILGELDAVTGQVRGQTQQFGQLLQDPGFTGQSEMGAMLKDASLLARLGEVKAAWDAIGFVPKKNVKDIQESFRKTWNALIDLARTQPKEQLAAWGFELKSLKTESEHTDAAPSMDARKKIQALEHDIAL